MNYPKMIKQYREKGFLSQSDLAHKLGVSFATVNRWENGHYEPTTKCKKQLHTLFLKAKIAED